MAPHAVPAKTTPGFLPSSLTFEATPAVEETRLQNLAERNTHTSSSLSESYAHRQQSAAAAFMSRDKCYASSANLVGMGGGGDFTTDATSFSGSEEKEVVDERPDFPSMQKQKHASLMKRVASTPVISTQSAGPAPGSQEMRDMFFVRQDAVNFNASYGTPVRQVLERQWAYHVECETCPHEWMLGGAALKIQAAREKLAAYVRAYKQDVSLVENCTAATTAAVRAAGLREGDVAIHLSTAYGMVKNCLGHAAAAAGAHVRELPVEFRGEGTAPCAADGVPLAVALAEMMDDARQEPTTLSRRSRGSRVALVTFDYIASCPGALMPVHAMARECKARGVPVLLDGAHVLGQIQLDCCALEASGVTYFMADAHKWLFSPKGSAMLWVTRAAQANCHPSVVGAVCSNSPSTNFNPAVLVGLSEYERRFQYTGTRDYTPLIAVRDALLFREKVGESVILGYNRGMAVWAQEWLAAVWRTETLVPAECTAFMAHARVPVRSSAAALLLNRALREDHGIHVMAFSLPARKHLGESAPTHWIRPCMQLFVHREDVRALGAAVLRLAVGADAAATLGARWLTRTRESKAARRAALEADAATFLDATAAHKVTVGFSVPPAFARRDSAGDLTQPQAAPRATSGFEVDKAGEPCSSTSSASGVEGAAAAAAAAVAKYSAAQQVHAPQLGHHAHPFTFALPALPEDREESPAEVADSFKEVTLAGSLGRRGVDFDFDAGGFKGCNQFAQSPTSIMDLGSSMASSMGTSVDGAGFAHLDWFNRSCEMTPGSAQPRKGSESTVVAPRASDPVL